MLEEAGVPLIGQGTWILANSKVLLSMVAAAQEEALVSSKDKEVMHQFQPFL